MTGQRLTIGNNPFQSDFSDVLGTRNAKEESSSGSVSMVPDPEFQLAMRKIIGRARLGEFSERIDSGKYEGYWRELAENINTILDSFVESKARDVQFTQSTFKNIASSIQDIEKNTFSLKLDVDSVLEAKKSSEKSKKTMLDLISALKQMEGMEPPVNVEKISIPKEELQTWEKVNSDLSRLEKLLSSINSQMNVLALNTIIEANRLQEPGKEGIVTIANELKQFVKESNVNLDNYSDILHSIQKKNQETAFLLDLHNESFKDLDRYAEELKNCILYSSREAGASSELIEKSLLELAATKKNEEENLSKINRLHSSISDIKNILENYLKMMER